MRIIYTSDTHSYLFPFSYSENKEENVGLMRISESFAKDDNTLIIDGGDTLQGSPLSTYVFEKDIRPFPQQVVFNTMGLDIAVPGNHDFNYGYSAFYDYFSKLNAKLLCSNLEDKTGKLNILKHIVVEDKSGLRLGFTGLVTDYVNVWEKPEHLENFVISDVFDKAQEEIKWLKENADVSILIYHGGFERNLQTGEILSTTKENVGCKIASELDYDLILSAHQHMEIPFSKYSGTNIIQCPANSVKYAELSIEDSGNGVEIKGELKKPNQDGPKKLENEYRPLDVAVNKWLDEPAGTIEKEIKKPTLLESALNGSHIADFFNTVQLARSNADISCTSLTNTLYGFKRELTRRDIIASYPFPNTLVILEVGEAELREALERCAEYFTLEDGKVTISKSFLEPKVENYNYDYYLGLGYTFDLSKPIGKRVVRLEFQGSPIEDRKLKLCMNNYRASGTGGYDVFRKCKVLKTIDDDIQNLAIDYLKMHSENLIWPYADFMTIGYENKS